MDVTEQIEEQRTDETSLPVESRCDVTSELPTEAVSSSTEPPPAQQTSWTLPNRAWLRLAYVFEFWIALLAIFTVWSQVGGQGHLDLIAWYIKLVCALALAWSAVRMTNGIVENARAWNRATMRWFVAVLAISALIAGITYWYHLHEVPDEQDTDENTASATYNPVVSNFFLDLSGSGRKHC